MKRVVLHAQCCFAWSCALCAAEMLENKRGACSLKHALSAQCSKVFAVAAAVAAGRARAYVATADAGRVCACFCREPRMHLLYLLLCLSLVHVRCPLLCCGRTLRATGVSVKCAAHCSAVAARSMPQAYLWYALLTVLLQPHAPQRKPICDMRCSLLCCGRMHRATGLAGPLPQAPAASAARAVPHLGQAARHP